MATKRRVSQKASARMMRQATAYYRLAAKAYHNGEAGTHHLRKANDLRDRAYRLKERGR